MLPQGPVITANLPEALASIPVRAGLERALHRALAGLQFTRPAPTHAHLASSGSLMPHLPPPLATR
ncbi:MAG: hypothetical protein IPK07_06415 [Deltaproteobacteria bacterium]|jgi:hypothetical protein|nr:hypothetical protein [Deltaproteobacteria bacterium]